jgi:hypothetical protein
MNTFITMPCPGCGQKLDTFRLTAAKEMVTLQVTCEPCRFIVNVSLAYKDLRALAEGKDVEASAVEEPEPTRVM